MDGPFRWVVAILIVAAIIALVVFARGEPEHGNRLRPRPRSSRTWSAEIVAAEPREKRLGT